MSSWYDIVTENTKHQPDVSVGQFGSLRPPHLHIWASKGLWARSLTVVTALVSSLALSSFAGFIFIIRVQIVFGNIVKDTRHPGIEC